MSVVDQHRRYAPRTVGFVIVTASDSRAEVDDDSGLKIAQLVAAAGHQVVARRVVRDQPTAIREAVLEGLSANGADVVVISGGTGFSPRDVTVEAVAPLLDRTVEGFGELFRMLSYEQVGAAAMLSRATAGTIGTGVVFVLPGSPKAVELGMQELILPEVAHLLGQLRREP